MRKFALVLIVGVGVTCLGLVLARMPTHRLKVRTYLHQAQGLKSGSAVSIDGVRVGSVERVDVRPDLGDHPVETIMVIGTSYEMKVPNDSVVRLETEGVLGPTVIQIDTRKAVGRPVENNGVLKSVELTDDQAAHALEFIGNALIDESKKIREKSPADSTAPSK